jgi:hypothetical protein
VRKSHPTIFFFSLYSFPQFVARRSPVEAGEAGVFFKRKTQLYITQFCTENNKELGKDKGI